MASHVQSSRADTHLCRPWDRRLRIFWPGRVTLPRPITANRFSMRLSRSLSFACVGACVAFASVPRTDGIGGSLRTMRHSTAFFGCESGFAFEASHDAARCRRLANVLVAPLIDCPQVGGVALVQRVDLIGTKDMCASTASGTEVSVERSCPAAYTKRVVTGPDRCELPIPEMIRAPSIPVAR